MNGFSYHHAYPGMRAVASPKKQGNQMTRELGIDELDTVSGGLALSSKGLALEANDREKDGRDAFQQVLKTISSWMASP